MKDNSLKVVDDTFKSVEEILGEKKKALKEQINSNYESGEKSLETANCQFTILKRSLEYSETALDMAGQVSNITVMADLKKQLEKLFVSLNLDQINNTPITTPQDGVAGNQPAVEVFGVVNTLFNESKGNFKVDIKKKEVAAMQALLQQIITNCQNAMTLFEQN